MGVKVNKWSVDTSVKRNRVVSICSHHQTQATAQKGSSAFAPSASDDTE